LGVEGAVEVLQPAHRVGVPAVAMLAIEARPLRQCVSGSIH
jgi:hypothetical protein